MKFGCILAIELVSIKASAQKGLRSKGANAHIYIGAMITKIMEKVGVDFSQCFPELTSSIVDYDYLLWCQILKEVGNRSMYIYKYMRSDKVARTITLPNQGLTCIHDNSNIYFLHDGALEHDPLDELYLVLPKDDDEDIEQGMNLSTAMVLRFIPRSGRERIFQKAYKAQLKVNKWCVNLIKKLYQKIKRTLGYVSSEEEGVEEGEEEKKKERSKAMKNKAVRLEKRKHHMRSHNKTHGTMIAWRSIRDYRSKSSSNPRRSETGLT